jgi:hypothetical protein
LIDGFVDTDELEEYGDGGTTTGERVKTEDRDWSKGSMID